MQEFADSLNRAMEARNMSQRELAQKVGVSQGTVNAWLKGTKVPSLIAAVNVSKALDCSLNALLGVRKTKPTGGGGGEQ